MIKDIEPKFNGKGEMQGFSFQQKLKSEKAYLYEVTEIETNTKHYEAFERRINTRFNCESYPNSRSFGVWAWTYFNYDKAEDKFNLISD